MREKFRIVKSEDEERRIAQLQHALAYRDYLYLVIQSLCFKKYKTYLELIAISRKFYEDKNLNRYILQIRAHRYLYDLGGPSSLSQKKISDALRFIKNESSSPVINEKHLEYRNYLSRLYLIAVVFDKREEQGRLIEIASRLRLNQSPILFLNAIEPLKKLIELESVDL